MGIRVKTAGAQIIDCRCAELQHGVVIPGSTGVGHAAPIGAVAFRADGRRLASGSADGSVFVWDTADPTRPVLLTAFTVHAPVTGLAWNPGAADLLAAGATQGSAGIWRVVDDRPPAQLARLAGHPGQIRSVEWMPDGQHLVCLFGFDRAAIWHAMAETYLGELTDCVRLAVSPDGLVATIGPDGTVAVRDLWRGTGPAARTLASPVVDCAWSPDGSGLALARADGALELVTAYLDPALTIPVRDGTLRCVSWSAGGPVAGGETGTHAFGPDGRPRWRSPVVLLRAGSLAVGGPLAAAATEGERPHLLALADGATLIAPALAQHAPGTITSAE
jgi:WD40 repeat protein